VEILCLDEKAVYRRGANRRMPISPNLGKSSIGHSTLLTVTEVAELLQVPASWVYDRTRSRGLNRIPGFRLGKYWRFQESEVLAWLEPQRSGGRANA